VAISDLVLKIAEAMAMPPRPRGVIVLERLAQPMPVIRCAVGTLGPVGHDDVRVTVRLLTGGTVRMLDDLHQPVDMRILAEVMAVDILVIVPVRHRPRLLRSGQTAASQEQPHQPGRRRHQQGPRPGDRLIERTGLHQDRLQPVEQRS